MKETIKKVKKFWGGEEWLANNEKYCGKILTLKRGFICSYHYHKNKDETFYILKGRIYIVIEGTKMILKKGEAIRLAPGQKHMFASLDKTSKIIEISTHHEEEDSYRDTQSRTVSEEELNEFEKVE